MYMLAEGKERETGLRAIVDVKRAICIHREELTHHEWNALGDAAVFELARRIFGRTVAWQALACQLMSASYFYCMSRSLSNSLETALTLGALALWPWQVLFRSLSWRCCWTCVSN